MNDIERKYLWEKNLFILHNIIGIQKWQSTIEKENLHK